MGRGYCYTCFKSARLCVCDVEPVHNRTDVRILQHPAERQHPINSARLTALGLKRARIDVAWGTTVEPPSDLPMGTAVLFPSAESRDLAALDTRERPRGLVVLDGTWSQARKLYTRNAWIRELPHVHLRPEAPSRYRIRRQPREGYLSTLEATVAALRILEPDTQDLERLIERFDRMIEEQAQFVESPPPGAYRHAKAELPGRAPRLPDTLATGESVVMVYGDFLADRTSDALQPVVISLARPATGEQVTLTFRGDAHHPALDHLGHMGLHPDEYAAAAPASTAGERIRGFLRSGETLCAWNAVTARHLQMVCGTSLPQVSLKADYCNWCKSRSGHLDEVVRELRRRDSRVHVPTHRLRAERRLGQVLAVYEWLQRDVGAVLAKYSAAGSTSKPSSSTRAHP
ncbi:MAG: tRNA-uridine aminocarboxypropyltransferase [Myxococcota bacterium]